MTSLQLFKNPQLGEIRTLEIEGQPYFVATDVCVALELGNTPQAMTRLDDDEKLVSLVMMAGQNRKAWLINESGLYSLILTSRKPEAKAFKKWVTNEVLESVSDWTTTSIAAELGMSAIALNKRLIDLGIQRYHDGHYVLLGKYIGMGYTKTRTHSHINGKGEMVTTRNTVWTEKGRMFIHSLFKMEVGA